MSVEERDNYSGYKTTGHEWNGIKELNTPLPRIIKLCLLGTFLFALGYWYFLPSWPLGDHYYRGKLGIDQRDVIATQIAAANTIKSQWTEPLSQSSFEEIQNNPELMKIVSSSGKRLFNDNCVMCHGKDGHGNSTYPSLSDQAWLWGGKPEQIYETLRVGINSNHPETRYGVMPDFGQLGAMDKESISSVAAYLRSLAKPGQVEAGITTEVIVEGESVYMATCTGCHGDDRQGNQKLGAPNLSDDFWLYGNKLEDIYETVWAGRKGFMPSWDTRLTTVERKLLSLYVLSLDQ